MSGRYKLETYRLLEATDQDEYTELSDAKKALYWNLLSLSVIDYQSGSNAKTLLWNIFAEGTDTRVSLEALERPPTLPDP